MSRVLCPMDADAEEDLDFLLKKNHKGPLPTYDEPMPKKPPSTGHGPRVVGPPMQSLKANSKLNCVKNT